MDRQKKTARKAYKVRVSANALQNIDEITGYIAFFNHQPLNAVKVGDVLFKVIDKIAVNPLAFRQCEEIPTKSKMYRRAPCYSWNIVFKITGAVLILGIIHSSRKPSKLRALKKVK